MSEDRDPRAWWFDDDPIGQLQRNKSHQSARDDGARRKPRGVRVIQASRTGTPFSRIFGSEPVPFISTVPKSSSVWHFSNKEISDLTLATFAFTVALGFFFSDTIFGALENPSAFIIGAIKSLLTIAPAFILHEIAHKIMAKRYGCWAEFRADPSGLRFGVIFSAITGWVFMAPGAVMVLGRTTVSQFGRIALAGPVTNIVLWSIGAIAVLAGYVTGLESNITNALLETWIWGNGVLALFNMIPLGPLDGKKIKTWSDTVFWIWLTIAAGTVYANIKILGPILGPMT